VTSPSHRLNLSKSVSTVLLFGGNVNQLKKLVIVNAGKNYFELKLDRHTTSE
jgi:hypothetical protein